MAANSESAGARVAGFADDEQIDGCLCGRDIDAADATPDDQLPAASGGVAAPPPPAGSEDDGDGDDAAVSDADITTDEQLPAAAGGVF